MSHNHFPRHWATAPLEDITVFITSGSRGWGDYYSDSGALFLRVGNLDHDTIHIDLSDSVRVQPPNGSEGQRTRVKDGDVLISITAEVGMIGLARHGLGEAYVNQHVALVRPLPTVYSEGLAYSLLDPQGLQAVVRREQYGATKPGLSLIQVRGFEVPIPPLPEQRRIVAAIESYLTRLDDAVATLERVQRNLKRYRTSVLKAAVEGRLVPTEAALARQEGRDYEPASALLERILSERRRRWTQHEKRRNYQEPSPPDITDLPTLPEGWCWTTIEQLCSSVTDGDHLPPPQTETGIPFVVISNLRNGSVNLNGTRFVSPEYYYNLDPLRRPQLGDILYTVTGSFGIPVLVQSQQEFCVQRHIAILRPLPLINAPFVRYCLASQLVFRQAHAIATGTAQKTVPLKGLRRMAIPLPPAQEQARILHAVERNVSLIEFVEQAVEPSREYAAAMCQAQALAR